MDRIIKKGELKKMFKKKLKIFIYYILFLGFTAQRGHGADHNTEVIKLISNTYLKLNSLCLSDAVTLI